MNAGTRASDLGFISTIQVCQFDLYLKDECMKYYVHIKGISVLSKYIMCTKKAYKVHLYDPEK